MCSVLLQACDDILLLLLLVLVLLLLQGISALREVQALCASVFTFGPNIC